MTSDICFLVFAHLSHLRQHLPHVRDHVRRFYGNCQILSMTFKIKHSQIFWLQSTQLIEMKQYQTFFQGTYSELKSFFIVYKPQNYFNDFYNWYLPISLQMRGAQAWKNQTGPVLISYYFPLFTKGCTN